MSVSGAHGNEFVCMYVCIYIYMSKPDIILSKFSMSKVASNLRSHVPIFKYIVL